MPSCLQRLSKLTNLELQIILPFQVLSLLRAISVRGEPRGPALSALALWELSPEAGMAQLQTSAFPAK